MHPFQRAIILVGVFLLLCHSGQAHRVVPREFACPICGEKFEDYVSTSGFSNGMRLDLKVLGQIPSPWPVQMCPKCKFILFGAEKDADGKELTPEDYKKLKDYVFSESYMSLPKNIPTYFRLARLTEQLEVSPSAMAHLYLCASWQAESFDKTAEKENRKYSFSPLTEYCQKRCLEYLHAVRNAPLIDTLEAEYLKVELNRRLGNFEEAKNCIPVVEKQLEKARKSDFINKTAEDSYERRVVGNIARFLKQQQELIGQGDDKPAVAEKDAN